MQSAYNQITQQNGQQNSILKDINSRQKFQWNRYPENRNLIAWEQIKILKDEWIDHILERSTTNR